MTAAGDDCPECEDAAKAGTPCPVCGASPEPEPVEAAHDVEATHTPAPIWDMAPRGEA